MSSPLHGLRAVLLLAVILGAALPVRAQAPRFAVGVIDKLEVKVLTKPRKDEREFLVVEVSNRGRLSAEPITFEILIDVPPDPAGRFRQLRFHRAGLRVWGRAGRAIRPGRSERYLLPSPWGEITPLDRTVVTISRASFFEGKGIDKPPVTVEKIEDFSFIDDFTKLEVTHTRARLKNHLPHPVNVFMRAHARTGGRSTLAFAALDPGETLVVGNPSSPNDIRRRLETTRPLAGRYEKLEIVDWSVLIDEGHEGAREALERAWSRQYRWPFPAGTGVEGKIRFEITDHPRNAKATGTATFYLPGEGRASLLAEPAVDAGMQEGLLRGINEALSDLRTPSLAELTARCEIDLVDRLPDEVLIVHARPKEEKTSYLEHPAMIIKDGVIVGAESAGLSLREIVAYTNGELPDGRVAHMARVIRNDRIPLPEVILEKQELRLRSAGGLITPEEATRESRDRLNGTPGFTSRIEFLELRPQGAREKGAASGEGVRALRAAWSRPYRYPVTPRDLQGTLEIECAATVANWLDEKELKGRLEISAWTGDNATPHGGYEFSLRGKFSDAGKRQMADLARARLTIWTRQDFAGRPLFDEAFKGCVIGAAEEEGLHPVVGHASIRGVRIAKGLPVEVQLLDGTRLLREFEDYRGNLVCVRINWHFPDHTAQISTSFKALGRGLIFPTRIEMRDWFSSGWGPEIYRYRLR